MMIPESMQSLRTCVEQQVRQAKDNFDLLDEQQLNEKPVPEKWSALECIDHLNRYARFYLLEIERGLQRADAGEGAIRWSWLGRKSIASVRPENTNPQQTFKRMNPAKSELGQGVLGEFYQHQSHFLRLLEVGDKKNLDAKVVRVEFFKLLKLRLGEAMEFVVVHQQRHLEQALRALLSTTPV